MSKFRCLLCGRDKFTSRAAHNCKGGYRKHGLKWEEIEMDKPEITREQIEAAKRRVRWMRDAAAALYAIEGREPYWEQEVLESEQAIAAAEAELKKEQPAQDAPTPPKPSESDIREIMQVVRADDAGNAEIEDAIRAALSRRDKEIAELKARLQGQAPPKGDRQLAAKVLLAMRKHMPGEVATVMMTVVAPFFGSSVISWAYLSTLAQEPSQAPPKEMPGVIKELLCRVDQNMPAEENTFPNYEWKAIADFIRVLWSWRQCTMTPEEVLEAGKAVRGLWAETKRDKILAKLRAAGVKVDGNS